MVTPQGLGTNDWLAVNQFTVSEHQHTRRPDAVLFVNGLPLVLIALKNDGDENATIWLAFQQLQTYQAELPTLFAFNAVLVVSDGVEARIGMLTAGREWFKPWRTVSGERLADSHHDAAVDLSVGAGPVGGAVQRHEAERGWQVIGVAEDAVRAGH